VGCNVPDKPHHLRLSARRVSNHQHVNVTTNVTTSLENLLLASEEQAEQALLHLIGTVDGLRERLCEEFKGRQCLVRSLLPGNLLDVGNVELGQRRHRVLLLEALHVVTKQHCLEDPRRPTVGFAREGTVDANQPDAIARLASVDKIVVQDDINRPWKLPGWCSLRHLLDCEPLVILVRGQAVLGDERVAVVILQPRETWRCRR
jgi:hypothetical protein